MSYILDALKKSEQERGHGNIPSVQTVHTSSLNYHDRKSIWPYVLIAAVLLNLVAIVYFYLDREKSPVSDTAVSETRNRLQGSIQTADDSLANEKPSIQKMPPSSPATAVPAGQGEQQTAATITAERSTPVSVSTFDNSYDANQQSPVGETQTVEDNAEVIDFHDLPDAVKQQLPSIVVSAHVYSSNPLQRSIVINNNFLEEGEYILDDLILQEITPDGAILYYQGTRFHYPVVSGWQ